MMVTIIELPVPSISIICIVHVALLNALADRIHVV